jgi:hypothetical protein
VFADGPQPATNMKTIVEASTVRMQIMAANECKGLPRYLGGNDVPGLGCDINLSGRGSPMSLVSTVGIDLAKMCFRFMASTRVGC